jgi:hypothetical protein
VFWYGKENGSKFGRLKAVVLTVSIELEIVVMHRVCAADGVYGQVALGCLMSHR